MKNQGKKIVCGIGLAVAMLFAFSASAEISPTVWADIPDVAPLRVGDAYYMVSTTMHFNPGIPIMMSKDLIDWQIVGYCYDTIENRPQDRLEGGNDYMYGTWASSLRYNDADGYFYVSSFNKHAKHTYLFRAKSVEGPWERHIYADRLVYDHSLWIENGRIYMYGSEHGKVYLHTLKPNLSGFEEGKTLVCSNINNTTGGGLAEGSQVFKHDGWYYIVNICWPKGRCRLVNVHRSRNMTGPFDEGKIVFEREGIAQGSFMSKPDGSWVAVLFGDRGGVGRIPFVLPVEWEDGWPIVKVGDESPYAGDFTKVPSCCASDEFDGETLKNVWQFNHNPDAAFWKLGGGAFSITTSRVDDDLLKVRNTITQRTFGPTCEAVAKVDGAAMKVGDKAGLSLFQHLWGAVSLQKTDDGYDVVLDQPDIDAKDRRITFVAKSSRYKNSCTREVSRRKISGSTIYLKAVCDFTPWDNPKYNGIPNAEDTGRFYYSEDGEKWEAIGETMWLPYTIPHFTGYRFALFNWATKEAGGTAAFDFFRLGCTK